MGSIDMNSSSYDEPWPSWPQVDKLSSLYVSGAVFSKRLSVSGSLASADVQIRKAEEEVAKVAGRKFAVLTANGSSAILLALQALEIGPGDKVAMPALTWIGCLTSILRCGATPVLIDCEEKRPVMDIEQLCKEVPGEFKAILAVHTYATLIDVPRIKALLPFTWVIEDFSHNHSATSGVRLVGSMGDLGICSLQASKILTCGEGGAIVTDTEDVYKKLLALRTDGREYGSAPDKGVGAGLRPGLLHGANFSISGLNASLLLDQITRLKVQNLQRHKGLAFLRKHLQGSEVSICCDADVVECGAFYGVPVRLKADAAGDADFFQKKIGEVKRDTGLDLWRCYPPVIRSEFFKPHTVKQYSKIQVGSTHVQSAMQWWLESLVIPHYALTASEEKLQLLGDVILGAPGPSKSFKSVRRPPMISVVILFSRKLDDLVQAITSVINQDYTGLIEIIVVAENCTEDIDRIYELQSNRVSIKVFKYKFDSGYDTMKTVEKVSRLRNISLNLVNGSYLCFLDDDNAWKKNHLSSLYEAIIANNASIAYSWRELINFDGSPYTGNTFPWICKDEDQSNDLYELCIKNGLMTIGSNIFKDKLHIEAGARSWGAVDMGAWLFDRKVFDAVRFELEYTEEEVESTVTEDDKLLEHLKILDLPVAVTCKATLLYRLGGYSNSRTTVSREGRLYCDGV